MRDDYIQKWIVKAINDIRIAGHELDQPDNDMVTDAICFHCQQSVEKLLKAFLASKNIDFGKTHNLPSVAEAKECFDIALTAKDFILKKMDSP